MSVIKSEHFNRNFLIPNNMKHKISDGYKKYIKGKNEEFLLSRYNELIAKQERDGKLVYTGYDGIDEYGELDALQEYYDRKKILQAILNSDVLQKIYLVFGDTPYYEQDKIKGEPIFNFKKPSQRCFYDGFTIYKGEVRVNVAYLFNDGKARQDQMYLDPIYFFTTYSPVKNKSRLSKIKALIKKTERNDCRLMHQYTADDYLAIAKSIDETVRDISKEVL